MQILTEINTEIGDKIKPLHFVKIKHCLEQATVKPEVGDWESKIFEIIGPCRFESARHSCRMFLPENDEVPCMVDHCPKVKEVNALLAQAKADARAEIVGKIEGFKKGLMLPYPGCCYCRQDIIEAISSESEQIEGR